MKKDVITKIEEIKNEKKLSKEIEKDILSKIIANWAICISLNILILAFVLAIKALPSRIAEGIYNISTIVFLILSIIVIEIAYKKDSGRWAITGLEILVVAVFVLFSPYIFIKYNYNKSYLPLFVVTIYYIIKIIYIYNIEKKNFLAKQSDINDIIKKESDDELAKKEKDKIKKEKVKQKEKEEKKKKIEKVKKEKSVKKQEKATPKNTVKAKNTQKKANKKGKKVEDKENEKTNKVSKQKITKKVEEKAKKGNKEK